MVDFKIKNSNVILIVADAFRNENLGCYGYPINTSPNIDKLARNGVVFKNAYTCNTSTDPSFTSIMSGLYPFSHGIKHHANKVTEKEKQKVKRVKFLAEYLSNIGYKTIGLDFLGRWHKRGFSHYSGLKEGSKSTMLKAVNKLRDILKIQPGTKLNDFLEGTPLYYYMLDLLFSRQTPYTPANKLTNEALEKMGKCKDDNFFLFIHYWDTHQPYSPPKKYLDRYSDADYSEIYKDYDKDIKYLVEKTCPPLSKFFLQKAAKLHKAKNAADLIRQYDAEVSYIDTEIGRLVEYLKKNNIFEDTLIIFMADHGESLTEHNVYFTHDGVYRETAQIPLIFHHPKLPQKKVQNLVQSVDLVPTILNLLDSKGKDSNFDGYDLSPLIIEDKNVRDLALTENRCATSEERAIFDLDYKYIRAIRKSKICKYCKKRHRKVQELYDLREDPNEEKNIYEKDLALVKRYKNLMKSFVSNKSEIKEKKEKKTDDKDEKVIMKRLEDLGYF